MDIKESIPIFFHNKGKILIISLFFIYVLFCIIQDFKRDRTSENLTHQLSNISASEIKKIEILGESEKRIVISDERINSKESKILFANAMNDLSSYSSSHDRVYRRFTIRMFDFKGNLYTYEAWLKMDDQQEMLYMYISKVSAIDGSNFQSLGGKKSSGLYNWLKHFHII